MLLVISMVLFALAISLWWFGRVAFTPVDDTSTTLAILDDSGIRSEIATVIADHLQLTLTGRGAEPVVARPTDSLFLIKASGLQPHGGGSRIKPGSTWYRRITRLITRIIMLHTRIIMR